MNLEHLIGIGSEGINTGQGNMQIITQIETFTARRIDNG